MKTLNRAILFIGLQFIVYSCYSQKQFNVLDWKTDVSLHTYLVQQMDLQYQARQSKLNNALQTQAGTQAYIQSVRNKFRHLLGQLPSKANLQAQINGTIQQDGYRIEKIVYQSFENHHVTSNLYVPDGKGKFPAVLLFCGHEDAAKATESYQKTAILLAKNGFVVFVVDPISQSERVQLVDEQGKALTRGSTTEHTLLNLSSNLLGSSVAAYELLDNFRAMDYLCSRPEVDANKIGCAGNSGGGMQTIYFAAFDERVKVIVPCSYLASRAHTFETTGAADGCAQIPNEGLLGLEMADYLIAAAPKPILVLAGRYDFIDYGGVLQSFTDLEKVYRRLGASAKLSLFTFDDGHGISKPKRERAVQWFRQWFYNDAKPVKEEDWPTLSEQELWATAKGKVSLSYPNETNIVAQNLKIFEQQQQSRTAFAQLPLAEKKAKISDLLGLKSVTATISLEQKGKVKAGSLEFEKIILRQANQLPMPLLVHYPVQKAKKVVIWLSDQGKNKLADSLANLQANVEADVALILADVRGMGETTDKAELNDPKYFNREYRNALLALHIGQPLIGQRTTDVLNLIAMIKNDANLKDASIEINAVGQLVPVALHVAMLVPQLTKLNLDQAPPAYEQFLHEPLAKDRYGLVIPNVLSYYDLPQLVQWIGPEKVQVHL
ncbi:acetylxylan esterase [Pedobacter sp. KR3-3]|uniref:Acetylxylan esterase n=1 Tax=Pedobacter albus TaxID=3113905 RepID=A0ABU7I5Q7_9SPHI|nr:acetylxylan esterase [Pedobacter sp. KR3-3]MEE1944651.1 acetylxylan esterase [Pedobacter sp. KR3-3]